MNLCLFDGPERLHLLPFTATRPVAAIRCGIRTLAEKWEAALGTSATFKTEDYLSALFVTPANGEYLMIHGGLMPNAQLVCEILGLKAGQSLWKSGQVMAYVGEATSAFEESKFEKTESKAEGILQIKRPWDIFSLNDAAIRYDFAELTNGRTSAKLGDSNKAINPENIFIEESAIVQGAFLNASSGPIYIGADAEVMEGSLIRGPFALCEHGGVKMGAKIYGATTVGPHCKVGGELNNVVLFAYSNKGHDGFLGNAVIGEWCNLGADTNNSNLKNNYSAVRQWSYVKGGFEDTGLIFCGLMMADHAKCGINTMFNTGTVVGVAANVFGAGFPRNFIPDFSWGGAHGFDTFQLPKVYEMARLMAARRHVEFTKAHEDMLKAVFDLTAEYRK